MCNKAFALLLVGSLQAQIQVSVSPVPRLAVERMLSKRLASTVGIWTVSLQNDSPGALSISESAVLRRIPNLDPIDHKAMALLIAEAQQNSAWARAGRIAFDLSTLAAFLGASRTSGNTLRWGSSALYAITAANVLAPYVVSRLKGQERPVAQNFQTMAWFEPLHLQPGEAATSTVFTGLWDRPAPVTFTIDTSQAPAAKMVQ